jgi:hypothetical protein
MTETVQILAAPKGGHTAFFTVPAADAVAAGLQANRHGVVGAAYEEIAASVDWTRANPTEFPERCPRCGAEKASDTGAAAVPTRTGKPRRSAGRVVRVPAYARKAAYACGGTYELKPQCQNHTDKWWGRCPVTRDRIAQVLAKHGVEVEGA